MNEQPLELEIQAFMRSGVANDLIIDHLENFFNWSTLNRADLQSICNFYILAGFSGQLVKSLVLRIGYIPEFPWAHFAFAIKQVFDDIDDSLIALLVAGAISEKAMAELSRVDLFDHFDPDLPKARAQRKQERRQKIQNLREELTSQVELMRSQGMVDQEETIILRFLKFFPSDPEAVTWLAQCRERRAIEIHARKGSEKPRIFLEIPSDEEKKILKNIESSQLLEIKKHPYLAYDFAVAHWMWDNPQATLRFLAKSPANVGREFFRLEALLRARRFLNVLEHADQLESKYALLPDVVFNCHYMKAQAMWGLDQKFEAVEILRTLCGSRPDFRSASALLAQMEEDLR